MFAVSRLAAAAPTVSRRAISASVVSRDLIQDLYIKELKAYKAPAVAKDAHLSAVKKFTPPSPPTAPQTLSSDLAMDLQSYDSLPVDLASAPAAKGEDASAAHSGRQSVEEYLADLRADVVEKEEAHH